MGFLYGGIVGLAVGYIAGMLMERWQRRAYDEWRKQW